MALSILVLAAGEIVLLVKLGQLIGGGLVIGLTLLTGILGYALLRHAGMRALPELVSHLLAGRIPAGRLLRREFALVLAGLLLLIPGFLGDAVGFLLLLRYASAPRPPRGARPGRSSGSREPIDVDFQIHDDPPEP